MNKTLEKDLKNIGNLLETAKKESLSFLNEIDKIPTTHKKNKCPKPPFKRKRHWWGKDF